VNVRDNHFSGDFLFLDGVYSRFEITTELSFQNWKHVFNQLSFSVSDVIEMQSHFLTVNASDKLIIPGTDRNDWVSMKVFSDQTMNRFRVVSFIHNITIWLSYFVTLSEQSVCVPGIVDPAIRNDVPGDHPLFGINRDWSFQEMLSNLACSDWVLVTGISAGKPGWIDRRYWDRIIVGIKQIQSFAERVAEVQGFYHGEEFLECCKMGYGWKLQFLLDCFHVSNIFNEFPMVLVPVIFEEN